MEMTVISADLLCVCWANEPILTAFQSPAKAVYNARHWNQPEPEEIPVPSLSRSQTAPVKHRIALHHYYCLGLIVFLLFFCISMLTVADCDRLKSFSLWSFYWKRMHWFAAQSGKQYHSLLHELVAHNKFCFFTSSPFFAVHNPTYCLLVNSFV